MYQLCNRFELSPLWTFIARARIRNKLVDTTVLRAINVVFHVCRYL